MATYEPQAFWSERLAKDFSLKGVGHAGYSEQYNRWLYRKKARTLAKAVQGIPLGSRSLDIGSGVGWVVNELYHHGFAVDGCDIADVAVDALRDRFPNSRFDRVTIGDDRLPAADASYDLVTMIDVSYHIVDSEQWARAVEDIARVLKPGGRFVVTDTLGPATEQVAIHVRFRGLPDWKKQMNGLCDLGDLGPLYKWLSRPPNSSPVLRRVPDAVRGPLEYALEDLVPRQPLLRYATWTKR